MRNRNDSWNIPAGYEAGTVMLWDQGTWTPDGNPQAGLSEGKLEFTLQGQNLNGSFVLVQMKERAANQWLLIKRHDRWARPSEEGEIVDEQPLSVLTSRSLEQIAADHDRIWTGCGGG